LLSMQHLSVLGKLAQAGEAGKAAASQHGELGFVMSDQDGTISFDAL